MSWMTPLLQSTADLPHPVVTVLLALAFSGIAALLARGSRRDRICYAAWFSVCSVAAVAGGAWAMFLIHG
ncbi:MAG TPA: hypothetical protein VHC72_20270 [Bryobacteraceae bacterium]|nr:hypothetical protein [Bryobacteraceae bacterium]